MIFDILNEVMMSMRTYALLLVAIGALVIERVSRDKKETPLPQLQPAVATIGTGPYVLR